MRDAGFAPNIHSAGYIARLFNIMRSAFIDATQIKLRLVVVGDLVEAATLARPPPTAAIVNPPGGPGGLPCRRSCGIVTKIVNFSPESS
jgi:hypothetical protein